jgi:uncharacterized protein (TIGR02145 family)
LWSAAVDGAGLFSDNTKGCGYGEHCEPTLPVRGACPEGWHLPDWDDWSELFDFVGGQGAASKALKSKMGWKDGANGLDTYGMALFPAGVRSMVDIGMYSCLDCYVEFWVSSYKDDYMSQSLSFGKEGLGFGQGTQDYAHSVRCIKDFDAADVVSSIFEVTDWEAGVLLGNLVIGSLAGAVAAVSVCTAAPPAFTGCAGSAAGSVSALFASVEVTSAGFEGSVGAEVRASALLSDKAAVSTAAEVS